MMTQQDVVKQIQHPDRVAVGGWSLDLHPSDGIYTDKDPCNQYHSKGVYGIPYRCYYSRNIENLFLAGRIISASHVAFGSTRVILTCAHGGSAVGMAAAQCIANGLKPRDLNAPERMQTLQQSLNTVGQAIPNLPTVQDGNLAARAEISASSTLALKELPGDRKWRTLVYPIAQLIPWQADYQPSITFTVRAGKPAQLRVALRVADKAFNFTPEITLDEQIVELSEGEQSCTIHFEQSVQDDRYAFITFYGDETIELQTSDMLCTGLMTVVQKGDPKVSKSSEQIPPEGMGIDRFEFWIPERRPEGKNLALQFDPPLKGFASHMYLTNGYERPLLKSNAWMADLEDPEPTLTLAWDQAQTISKATLFFDTDFDHAMETAQWGHPESVMPHCVREFRFETGEGNLLAEVTENHQTRVALSFDPVSTTQLILKLKHPGETVPAALLGLIIE